MKKKLCLIAVIIATLCAALFCACGDSGNVTVEFVSETGESFSSVVRQTGGTYGELPIPSERKYYEFVGWNTEPNGNGITVGPQSIIEKSGKVTLYAEWKYIGKERSGSTVSGQSLFQLAIDDNGELWSWGYNQFRQLGNGTGLSSYSPAKVKTDKKFISVATGSSGSSDVWPIGKDIDFSRDGVDFGSFPLYRVLRFECEVGYAQASIGSYHSVALDNDGNIWTWGKDRYGNLGQGYDDHNALMNIVLK